MAVKLKGYKKEDLLVGFFVVIAILYPFLVAGLIFYEDFRRSSIEVSVMRKTYEFLVGLERCDRVKAEEIASFMSDELLSKLGGVRGMVQVCVRERSSEKVIGVSEELNREGRIFRLVATLKRREKGIAKPFKSVVVVAVEDRTGFKVVDVKISKL